MLQTFKQMLAAEGDIPLFAVGRIMHPVMIEMFALEGGYRGFWIDQEHCTVTMDQITVAALAGRAE